MTWKYTIRSAVVALSTPSCRSDASCAALNMSCPDTSSSRVPASSLLRRMASSAVVGGLAACAAWAWVTVAARGCAGGSGLVVLLGAMVLSSPLGAAPAGAPWPGRRHRQALQSPAVIASRHSLGATLNPATGPPLRLHTTCTGRSEERRVGKECR